MKGISKFGIAAVLSGLVVGGCTTYTTRVHNAPGRPTTYVNPATPGPNQGVGIESQDLISMTDRMVPDMLANRTLAASQAPPRVVVDARYFRNEGTSRINKNAITDRLRVLLNRAAGERMVFIGRHYANMVEHERNLKGEGTVDLGTTGRAAAPAGADYRLGGRITTLDAVHRKTGLVSRHHQITFEMVRLETGQIVWSGIYEFKKAAQDDIIYR